MALHLRAAAVACQPYCPSPSPSRHRNVSKEEIEAFVKADPYVQNGLVPSYTIRPYMVVAGDCQ